MQELAKKLRELKLLQELKAQLELLNVLKAHQQAFKEPKCIYPLPAKPPGWTACSFLVGASALKERASGNPPSPPEGWIIKVYITFKVHVYIF